MPKAVIEDQFAGRTHRVLKAGSDEPDEWVETIYPAHFVQVGWNKDLGNVDIATREGGDVDGEDNRQGFTVNLDWHGINRLIRELRTARDAAFGRAE